ncbi:MAG: outer membrane lipoprotein carrier protein LolA [Candidatus Cryptobacteroides sp.]
MFTRTFFTIMLAAMVSIPVSAQRILDQFKAAVSSSSVNLEYSYKAVSGTMISGSGTLLLQGDSFHMKGDGLEIWCDGKTRWTLDRAAGEMVVENVEDADGGAAAADPAMLLGSLDTHFKVVSSSVNGGLTEIKFEPQSGALGITSLTAVLKPVSGGAPVIASAAAVMSDGTLTEFSFKSMSYSDRLPLEDFKFNMSEAGKSWIITDLR